MWDRDYWKGKLAILLVAVFFALLIVFPNIMLPLLLIAVGMILVLVIDNHSNNGKLAKAFRLENVIISLKAWWKSKANK